MRSAAIAALAAIGAVSAMPSSYASFKNALNRRADGPTDTQVLQYALTLENLEKRLYADALSQFDEAAFAAAGYPSWVRGRISQIAGHEADHVSLLSGALGNASVAECTYNFPYTDVKSFVGLTTLIENVGVSAYAGAAQYITDKDYLTVAAVILSTEARHQAWESAAIGNANPWGSAYDTPLGLDMVYTLASAFITSCPDSNAALPVKAYPTLTVGEGYALGSSATFTFDDPRNATNYVVFYEGLGSRAIQLDENDSATIPTDLQGIVYAVISTSSDPSAVADDNIVAGPAILDFPFNAWTANPAFSG
ncbi:uncharacterized protein I206_106839 [Kwoniella pini CBS 10737]|uniref:Ferritin-like domain-containing protein n=1 Tax=Kwoniella pini CBS 10737 TaxID=1296096 RepID=A0A1B9I001_9TREE|nr:uncharacterized protein I206_05616 [Kwoniella pini CBS 10737]OCF48835.1 hypothetical protein I206_05616 [Kwoniella pini CBS 10737]